MANEIAKLFVTIGLDDSDLQKNLKTLQGTLTSAGKQMTLLGGSITASMGLAVKAAIDQNEATARLAQTIENTGIAYAGVAAEIEKVVAAQMKKTNFSDEEQMEALNSLVFTTGDYKKALALLPEAMDLAAAKQIGLSEASLLLGKVNDGTVTQLKRMGISISEQALEAAKAGDSTQALAEIYDKVRGSAEATANPFSILKNNFEDMGAKIGSILLPVLKQVVDKIVPIIENIMKWVEAHPALAKTITIIVAAIGGLMAVLGPLLMMLPLLASGFTILLGPVGLIILAVAAVAAGAALLILNWDKVKAFFANLWDHILGFFKRAWEWLKENWPYFLGLPGLIIKNWDKIADFFGHLWDGIKNGFKNAINFLIGLAEGWVNFYIKAVNFIIRALNSIQVHIPDWIPLIGGKTFGINISPVPEISLPRLAAGGIAMSPTLAMVGDNPAGEAIIPLDKLGGRAGGMGGLYIAPGAIVVNGWVGNDQQLAARVRDELLRLQMSSGPLGFVTT